MIIFEIRVFQFLQRSKPWVQNSNKLRQHFLDRYDEEMWLKRLEGKTFHESNDDCITQKGLNQVSKRGFQNFQNLSIIMYY